MSTDIRVNGAIQRCIIEAQDLDKKVIPSGGDNYVVDLRKGK